MNRETRRIIDLSRRRAMSCFAAVLLLAPSLVLASGLLPVRQTSRAAIAYAAPMEDCDLDGYDDHTGAPVPWAGFDGTRGDVVPAGWDGVANSWTGEHGHDGGTASTGSGSAGSSTSGTGAKSSSGTGAKGSTNGGSESSSGSTQKTTSTSDVTGGSSTAEQVSEPAASSSITQNPVSSTSTSAGVAVVSAVQPSETSTESVLETKGRLAVSDSKGAAVHVGGTARLLGVSFAPWTDGLVISVDTTSQRLQTVSSDGSGRFQSELVLPGRLAPGVHRFIVSYAGVRIASRVVVVGPAAANTFIDALRVGFTDGNPDRRAGLGLLGGLAVAGVVGWGSGSVRYRIRQH